MSEESKTPVLEYKTDKYRCATIAASSLPEDEEKFKAMMERTVSEFEEKKIRGFWLKIPAQLSQLIPVAMKHPFNCEMHHTDSSQALMLIKWLDSGACRFPVYCTHLLGAGGLVFNTKTGKLLLMQERWMEKPAWKISGGQVDPKEWIEGAAEREVWEETGVKVTTHGILASRELLRFRWNRADIYYIVLCLTEQEEINIDKSEALKAEWFTIEEVIADSFEKSMTFNWVAKTLKEIYLKHHKEERPLYEIIRDEYVERSVKLHVRNAQSSTSDGIYRFPKI